MAIQLPVIPYNPNKPAPGNEKPGYYGPPTPGTETAPFPAPGVPKIPTGEQPGPGNGSPTTTPGGTSSPRPISADIQSYSGPGHSVKSALLRPALTSHFQLWINPPQSIRSITNYNGNDEFFSLSCTEASLPGSSLLTNEINDDYTGITERIGYRKQYDNTTDFTFLVDAGVIGSGYNVIRFFESWIRYAMGETSKAQDENYFYRVRFPDGPNGYRSKEVFLNKFEKDYNGEYLQYTFIQAYPISINSMPVSYDSSQLLKCTVSFTYNRYVLNNIGYSGVNSGLEPIPGTPAGIPNPLFPSNPNSPFNNPVFQSDVDTFGQDGFLLNQNPFNTNIPGFNL
jgi:hypothetical protein